MTHDPKHEYYDHLRVMNPGATDEGTYRASCFYYEAELLPILPPDRSLLILDVGCGFGHLLRFCVEHGYQRVAGVEIDERLYEAARAYVGARVERLIHDDAIRFLGGHPQAFDVITLFDVIEHFRREEAMEMAVLVRKALRPGGVAIFRTPNMANLLGVYSRYLDLTHQCGYTEQSLAQLLKIAGFAEPRLHLPVWRKGGSLARRLRVSRWMHRLLIGLQDRASPKCVEKNVVMWAGV